MKKLMIAFAAVALATCAQAVSVSWSATGLKDIYGTAWASSTQFTTYSAVATFWDSTGATQLATSDGTFTQKMGSFAGSWGDAAVSTTYYAQLVITDKDGNAYTSEKASFTTTTSGTRSINFATGNNFDSKTNKFADSEWVAAPEPTSGLLLLLGVAGLALRRKQK